jgi:DNA invertase Pin-like site-specific DNA recombinase
MSVAIYARVSSDRQREEGTIASQVQQLKDFASAQGQCPEERHIYLDDGRSGYYLDRPGLDALRDAARDGLVDTVLVQDPDRLSRKYAYQVLLLEEFARWQVTVRFLRSPPAESPEQRLLVQMQGVIAEYERARITERTRRGRLFLARQGRPVSGLVPYGYRRVRPDRDQLPSMEVDPQTAEIVQQIFHWYAVDRLSDRQISVHLTNMGTPPRRRHGHTYWHPGSVRTILMNDAYLGTWYANRYKNESRGGRMSPPYEPTAGHEAKGSMDTDTDPGFSQPGAILQGSADQRERHPQRAALFEEPRVAFAETTGGLWPLQSENELCDQPRRAPPLLLVPRKRSSIRQTSPLVLPPPHDSRPAAG